MKDKPILFSADMVNAILEGRKTQTRRVVKNLDLIQYETDGIPGFQDEYGDHYETAVRSPYGVAGDRLWVKEPFRVVHASWKNFYGVYTRDNESFEVQLTNEEIAKFDLWKKPYGGKSSLFMFKSLARLWLKVTNVRVERLQEISEADALAEGTDIFSPCGDMNAPSCSNRCRFKGLWDSINGKPQQDGTDISWDANPWVWVVEFKHI